MARIRAQYLRQAKCARRPRPLRRRRRHAGRAARGRAAHDRHRLGERVAGVRRIAGRAARALHAGARTERALRRHRRHRSGAVHGRCTAVALHRAQRMAQRAADAHPRRARGRIARSRAPRGRGGDRPVRALRGEPRGAQQRHAHAPRRVVRDPGRRLRRQGPARRVARRDRRADTGDGRRRDGAYGRARCRRCQRRASPSRRGNCSSRCSRGPGWCRRRTPAACMSRPPCRRGSSR